MAVLLLLHLAAGLLLLTLGSRHGRWALVLAATPLVATLAWLVARRADIAAGVDEVVDWVPQLGLALDLRVDGFSALMLVLVAGIGVLVVAYSGRYFQRLPRRLLGLLVLFAGAMTGVVVADNLLVLYGFWELTSITSFLLIGDDHRRVEARAAALHALLVTGAGSLAMLAGFILLGQAAGTYELSAILADPPSGTIVTTALVLVLLGAFTKSAQYPFHSWLAAAMVAPTPISTYLHSATMVKAGVYVVARLAPAFAATVDGWRPIVVTVGLTTMILGGLRALRQNDLKLLLAMGTISQLGLMMVVLGWGGPGTVVAGAVLLLAHGTFKAAAFMVVGILDHQHGTRDVRRLARPGPGWSATTAVTIVAGSSMAGIPLLLGFVAKEEVLGAFVDKPIVLAGIVAGSMLTAAYSYRFVAGALGRLADDSERSDDVRPGQAPAPTPSFLAPAALLAIVTIVFGCAPGLLGGVVDTGGSALHPLAAADLAPWHGVTTPLVLSLLILATGGVLFAARRPIDRLLAVGAAVPSAADAYQATLRGVDALARRTTAITQPGSLPLYLGVILTTAVVVPGALLLSGSWWPGWPDVIDLPAHAPLAALLVAAATAAAIVRRRFAGALLLGLVGYAMAGVFVAQGAPDLALTQAAIETLTTVLFVLVLRRLPDHFEPDRVSGLTRRRALRVIVSATVGVVVFLFTLAVGSIDESTAVSEAIVDDALPEADGRNVVNTILVDFRSLDTLGEITVLTAAAIGTVALARAGRRPVRRSDRVGAPDHMPSPPPVRQTRLVTIDVSVRIVFAAVMVGSLWLLFAGHNQPGGGFVGGLVAGAAVALRYVQGGLPAVRALSRGQPWFLLGAGCVIATVTALVPLLAGREVLDAAAWSLDLPVLGAVKLTSALAFDIGVYLVVIGVALMVFESFGDDSPGSAKAPESESESEPRSRAESMVGP
ncbi:MAG: hydrogen gas-evolving membrane-bound hydrogenase subunit E [Ilumatobacteraceae bacterium]